MGQHHTQTQERCNKPQWQNVYFQIFNAQMKCICWANINHSARFCSKTCKFFSVDWTSDLRNQRGNPSHTHPSTAPGCARRLRLQWSGPQSQLRIDASAQIHSTVLLQRFKFLASKNARCRFNSRLCCQYQQSIPELPNRHRVRAAST